MLSGILPWAQFERCFFLYQASYMDFPFSGNIDFDEIFSKSRVLFNLDSSTVENVEVSKSQQS